LALLVAAAALHLFAALKLQTLPARKTVAVGHVADIAAEIRRTPFVPGA